MSTYHGILNIDKPAGWTSHDVVGKVRRLLHQKRVGHAGTLDPAATGVLLVCVGQATRVAEFLMAGRKVYRAVVQLGLETDTYDLDGAVVASAAVPPLTAADLTQALAHFTGALSQIPPAYSAIKQAGVPAYRKARRGEAVELAPRPVTIHDITLRGWQSPQLTLDVTCDPGTYIRSLAHDLGQALGCGAVLAQLIRLQSGAFRLEDAVSLAGLAAAADADQVARYLHPLQAALADLTPVPVDAALSQRLLQGQAIPAIPVADWPIGRVEAANDCASTGSAGVCAAPRLGYALTADGTVQAILAYDSEVNVWRPKKVFGTSDE